MYITSSCSRQFQPVIVQFLMLSLNDLFPENWWKQTSGSLLRVLLHKRWYTVCPGILGSYPAQNNLYMYLTRRSTIFMYVSTLGHYCILALHSILLAVYLSVKSYYPEQLQSLWTWPSLSVYTFYKYNYFIQTTIPTVLPWPYRLTWFSCKQ